MVAARSQPAVRPRRAAEAGGRQLLSRGRDEGRDRALDAVAARSRAQPRATGFFTVDPPRPATASRLVPYNIEYQNELTRAAALLREAAALATEPTLKAFLTKRADAFLSNDYYDSDVAWMELKGAIEPTIGPYEVYEDECSTTRPRSKSYITVQDEAETAKLQRFAGELQDIENHLPIDPKHRNPKLGALAPIVVVNEIYRGRRRATAACRPRPSTCRTTSASSARRAPSA